MRLAILALVAAAAASVPPALLGQTSTYTVYLADGRHALPFRTLNNVDYVALDQLAPLFKLTVSQDAVVSGLTITAGTQTILAIPGQSFASLGGGRIVSLPAPVQNDRGSWVVPIDFIRQAVGPALGLRVEIRRASHVVLTGDIRLPEVAVRSERSASGARLTLEVQPATPHGVTRTGRQLAVRFDAVAVDLAPVSGLSSDFVAGVRADGSAILIDLGPSATSYRVDDPDPTHVVIDLVASAATLPVMPRVQAPPPPTAIDTSPSGGIHTIVIDPGHGGDDTGVVGPGGTTEKDVVLRVAQRLKTTIENRYGLRVLLTRTRDEHVTADRRTALANNNKADLYLSLHANASVQRDTRGAEVLSLDVANYSSRPEAVSSAELPVPVAGGGTRTVDVVPWDLAQLPFAATSATIASLVSDHLKAHGVMLYTKPTARMPLRPLVGANMPAVMVEIGFLTNPDDEAALGQADTAARIADALADTINDIRQGLPVARAGGTP